jgi:polyhydroxyalkanoate synthesis regulator phasin
MLTMQKQMKDLHEKQETFMSTYRKDMHSLQAMLKQLTRNTAALQGTIG